MKKALNLQLVFALVQLFMFFCFRGFAQDNFWIGVWCLTGDSDLGDIITTDANNNYVLESTEKTLLEDLGLNYMIACTRGDGPPYTTNGEVALNNYGIEKNGAFKSTLEISPANSYVGTPYQVWARIATGAGPTNPTWCAAVDTGYFCMDTLHNDKTGVHSFLAGAETNLENSARHSWLDYICESIHNNATDVPALVQDDYAVNGYLDDLFTAVDAIDVFNYHYYVFDEGLPYAGTSFQNALSDFASSISYAQTELQDHYGDDGVPLHYITQVHLQPTGREQRQTTSQEILCQNNLSLAYGAKGIVYYLYGSLYGGVNGLVTLARNTTTQYNNVRAIHDNYQNTGKTFYEIASEFMNLTWKTGISVHSNANEPINGTYDIYDVQSWTLGGSLDAENQTFIEVGVLQDAGNKNHYMIVNRRCSNEAREVKVKFESTSNHAYLVTDVFTDTETRFLPAGASTFAMAFILGDGEAKLLKVEDLGVFSGSITSNTTWDGIFYVNTDIEASDGVTLTVGPGAEVKFAADRYLLSEGEIDADGAAFQSAGGGDWYGIIVAGEGKSYFGNCTITGCTYGFVVEGSTERFPDLYRCDIQATSAGFWITESRHPWVEHCYIKAANTTSGAAVLSTNNAVGYFIRCKLYGPCKYGHKNDNSAVTHFAYYSDARNLFDDDFQHSSIYVTGGAPYYDYGKNAIPSPYGLYAIP